MRRAAAAAVAVVAGTVLFMISACGGGGEPGGDGAAPAGRGTPADHATGPPPTEGAGGPGTDGGADATPPPRPDPDDPTTPLDGTRWTVDTVIVDGATLAVPAGPSGSAWLAIEGARFRAVTGCGEVEGRVRIDGGVLRFSDVTEAVPIHCPDEFAPADRVMRELFTTRARFAVTSGQLRLDHPGGNGLRLHASPEEPGSAPRS
ncbi:MAG TPA: META domain-containing protein [Natronosporangium sp.]|nr:META domain-containing protein [Natronosporangium sp.]